MTETTIPTISFKPFLHGNAEQRASVAQQIYEAFHTIGFLYLEDSGVTQQTVDNIFALAKRFFQLPLEFKKAYTVRDANENQGYSPDWADMEPEQQKHIPRDHKESYEHRRFRNEQCPTPDELAKFDASIADYREALDEFYQQCFKLSKEVLRCLAIALKLPGGEKFFEGMMEEADPQLRLLHYPPRPVEAIASAASNDGKDSRIKPHCDYGFCTLLFQDSVGGLEVDPFHTGNYTPAPPKEGTVLINIGDLLNRLLNNRVKSTMHRVVAPPVKPTANGSGVQMLPSRYSIPFFVHPHPSFDIDPVLLDKDEKKLYKSVNAGEWRAWRTSLLYDFKDQEKEYLNKLGIQESEVAGLTRG